MGFQSDNLQSKPEYLKLYNYRIYSNRCGLKNGKTNQLLAKARRIFIDSTSGNRLRMCHCQAGFGKNKVLADFGQTISSALKIMTICRKENGYIKNTYPHPVWNWKYQRIINWSKPKKIGSKENGYERGRIRWHNY